MAWCINLPACAVALVASFAPAALAQNQAGCQGEWTQVSSTGPSNRFDHAMAFDSARGRTVLFGGRSAAGRQGDTWEWNGAAWTLMATTGPTAREWHAMAYDPLRNRTVLFGGIDATGSRNDTWEWNGTTWTQIAGPAPTARGGHRMAFDAARGRIVLFGGIGPSPPELGDTWERLGTTWSQVSDTGPVRRSLHTMAYDPVRGRVVLHGGQNGQGTLPSADGWEWMGAAWQFIANGPGAGWGGHRGMAPDPSCSRLIMFGVPGDTTTWALGQNNAWTAAATTGPIRRSSPGMVYDSARDRIVLFGGYGQSTLDPLGDTWEWNGSAGARVTITNFTPQSAGIGQVVTIDGSGFGNDPDNLCVALTDGSGGVIGLDPLSVTDTRIRARLPRFRPGAHQVPQRLMVGRGDGDRVELRAPGASAIPLGLSWVWKDDPAIAAGVGPGFFTPVWSASALSSFHSGPPMSGNLMLTIDQDWGPCTQFQIYARIWSDGCNPPPTGKWDTNFTAVFAASGTRFECAEVICNLLETLFAAHATQPLQINCVVTNENGNAKITVSLPNDSICDGQIDVTQVATCSSCTAQIKRLSTPLVPGQENVAELVRYQVNTTGAAPTSIQWAVEAPIVEDFDERVNTGYTTDPMDSADFTNPQIQFYWKPNAALTYPLPTTPNTPVNRRISVAVQTASGMCADSILVPVYRHVGLPGGTGQPVDYYTTAHPAYNPVVGAVEGRVLAEHASWHYQSNFTTYRFFFFHRVILARYNAWRVDFGYAPEQAWLPTMTSPQFPTTSEITPHPGRNTSYPALVPTISFPSGNPNRPVTKPSWFHLSGLGLPGGGAMRPGLFGACPPLNQVTLGDWTGTPIPLNCAVEGPWHGDVHWFAAGGDMNHPDTAPKDGLFYAWHLGVDSICQDYENLTGVQPMITFFTPFVPWSRLIDSFPPEGVMKFGKAVINVEPGLYTVNGSKATYVRGEGAGPYYFGGYDVPTTYGPVVVRLDPGNIITPGSPPFEGHTLTYELADGQKDHDGDGLPTYDEINTYNSDPETYDSDGDSIGDGDELRTGTGLRNRLSPCRVGHLLVADPTGRRVMLLDQCDGSIVDPNFIAGAPVGMRLPFEAIQVRDAGEIWVSDQRANAIFRFDLQGQFLSTIAGEIDQVRGLEVAHGHVYAIHTEDANGAILHRVVRYMPDGTRMDDFQAGENPYDVKVLHHDLLITDINNEAILRFDPMGTPMGAFHQSDGSTGIDFPTQLADDRGGLAYGTLLAGGFSEPNGIYIYDHNGAESAAFDVGSEVRGVYQLGNGDLLYTADDGVYVYDVSVGLSSLVSPGRGMFINEVFGAEVSKPCYADCDRNKMLDIFDFLCFQNAYASNDPYACDCDTSSGPGTCDIFDFLCFQNAFDAGCP